MPSIAVAAMGALLVAFVYEVNPQLGAPLLGLVLLALLIAAFNQGNLAYVPIGTRIGNTFGSMFGNATPGQSAKNATAPLTVDPGYQ